MKNIVSPALVVTAILIVCTSLLLFGIGSCGMNSDPYISQCASSYGRIAFPNSLSYFSNELGLRGWREVLLILISNGLFLAALWSFSFLRSASIRLTLYLSVCYIILSIGVAALAIYLKLSM